MKYPYVTKIKIELPSGKEITITGPRVLAKFCEVTLQQAIYLIRNDRIITTTNGVRIISLEEPKEIAPAYALEQNQKYSEYFGKEYSDEFRGIPEFETYRINKEGVIFNTETNRFTGVKAIENKIRYPRCLLDGSLYRLHRVMAVTWCSDDLDKVPSIRGKKSTDGQVEDPDEPNLVDHIDRDPTNCHADNLRWVSIRENNTTGMGSTVRDRQLVLYDLEKDAVYNFVGIANLLRLVGGKLSSVQVTDLLKKEYLMNPDRDPSKTIRGLYKGRYLILTVREFCMNARPYTLPEVAVASYVCNTGSKEVTVYKPTTNETVAVGNFKSVAPIVGVRPDNCKKLLKERGVSKNGLSLTFTMLKDYDMVDHPLIVDNFYNI